jgi:hypothetical protein
VLEGFGFNGEPPIAGAGVRTKCSFMQYIVPSFPEKRYVNQLYSTRLIGDIVTVIA